MQTRYTAKSLVYCLRTAKENAHINFAVNSYTTLTASEFIKWFRKCLHEKINRNLNHNGRKFQPVYQGFLQRDARIINDYAKRINRRGTNLLSTPELKRKYPHINTNRFEE